MQRRLIHVYLLLSRNKCSASLCFAATRRCTARTRQRNWSFQTRQTRDSITFYNPPALHRILFLRDILALQCYRQRLRKLSSLFLVLHDQGVQVLRASNLELQSPLRLLLNGNALRILPPGGKEKLLDILNLLRLHIKSDGRIHVRYLRWSPKPVRTQSITMATAGSRVASALLLLIAKHIFRHQKAKSEQQRRGKRKIFEAQDLPW